MDKSRGTASPTRGIILLNFRITGLLKLILILILNSIVVWVVVLGRGYVSRSLRIKTILCVLGIHRFYCVCGVRSMNERLRADGARLDHRLIKVLSILYL